WGTTGRRVRGGDDVRPSPRRLGPVEACGRRRRSGSLPQALGDGEPLGFHRLLLRGELLQLGVEGGEALVVGGGLGHLGVEPALPLGELVQPSLAPREFLAQLPFLPRRQPGGGRSGGGRGTGGGDAIGYRGGAVPVAPGGGASRTRGARGATGEVFVHRSGEQTS